MLKVICHKAINKYYHNLLTKYEKIKNIKKLLAENTFG